MSARPTLYGRVYTPRNHHPYRPPAVDSLADSGIRYIRLQWTDFTNLTRFRVLPLATFLALLESERPGVGITKAAFGLVGATLAEGFSVTGEYVYVPDTESLRICDYAPGHASVMGWFEWKEPEAHMVKLCPRTLLKRIEEEAAAASVEFLVGIKTEFILLESIDPITPASNGPWSSSAKLRSGSISALILEDIAEVLQKGGIELIMYHGEAAPGQYDVVTGPLAPLQAADALVFTRETIYNIASKHGKRATFAPRLFTDECGSAANVSISVHRMGISNDHTDDNVMNALERSFLQGMLNQLRALAALTLPTPASYGRVQDSVWSGGTYVCWGRDNLEVPVRVAGSTGARRFEVRCMDGTANPHIALAGLLGAGLQGVKRHEKLKVKECKKAARDLSPGRRIDLGIGETKLPKSLAEARFAAQFDSELEEIFGDAFLEKYLAVNTLLESSLSADRPEAKVQKLLEMY